MQERLALFLANWKTTALGVGLLLGAVGSVLQDIAGDTPVNAFASIQSHWEPLVAGFGLLVAGDAKRAPAPVAAP